MGRWRKIRSHHWNAKGVIGRCVLKVFGKRPVRSRMQGVVGLEAKNLRLPDLAVDTKIETHAILQLHLVQLLS